MKYGLTMHEDEKRLWTTALRSGDFLQGKHRLRGDDGASCCLGVYAETKQVPRTQPGSEGGDYQYNFGDYDSFTNLDSDWFSQFFDWDSEARDAFPTKSMSVAKLTGDFMQFNDGDGWDFPRIADWIEANL